MSKATGESLEVRVQALEAENADLKAQLRRLGVGEVKTLPPAAFKTRDQAKARSYEVAGGRIVSVENTPLGVTVGFAETEAQLQANVAHV